MSSVDTYVADRLMLIRAQYLEIPGLSLTKQQVGGDLTRSLLMHYSQRWSTLSF